MIGLFTDYAPSLVNSKHGHCDRETRKRKSVYEYSVSRLLYFNHVELPDQHSHQGESFLNSSAAANRAPSQGCHKAPLL